MDALRRHHVDTIFGYPGGAILPIYDALHIAESEGWVKHILVRHEQAGTHAADAYARATGKVGVCFGTSGPGATNLVTGIATAQMDSVPMVVITGQVPRPAIGTDAFQETDIFGITLPIVKHSWVVRDPADLASIVAQAFLIAASGRPGPVLIDIPKDVGQEMFDYVPVEPGAIVPKGFRKPQPPRDEPILSALELIAEAERPLLYVGGGAISAGAHDSLRVIAERYQIPVTTTLMGKGAFDENDPLSVGMLGMHGTAYANFAVTECDLLIAVGARFDDRVTGKLDTFAPRARVIHFEIDPAEIGKTRRPDVAVLGDLGLSVARLVELSLQQQVQPRTSPWLARIAEWRQTYPLTVPPTEGPLFPQEVLLAVRELAPNAIVTTDVGQHQMWAAQFFKFREPRTYISSLGLGTMGFGLPAAIGAKVARPDKLVVNIDGDGCFMMNIQELATAKIEKINAKTIILNNQHLGMVVQWEDRFYKGNRGHTYLGDPDNTKAIYPDYPAMCAGFGVKCERVMYKKDLPAAMRRMLAAKEPYVLEVITPYTEHVLPFIPAASAASVPEWTSIGVPSSVIM